MYEQQFRAMSRKVKFKSTVRKFTIWLGVSIVGFRLWTLILGFNLCERIFILGLTSIFISQSPDSGVEPPITAFSDVMKEQKELRGGAPVTMLPWTPIFSLFSPRYQN